MSACLFTVSNKFFEKASIEEIEARQKLWADVIKETEATPGWQDNAFLRDRYWGYETNYGRSIFVLIGARKSRDGT